MVLMKRWRSFLKLKKEAKYSEDKKSYYQEMKKLGESYAKRTKEYRKK